MIYHSLEEIFDHIEESHNRFTELVQGLSARQENFRPVSEHWSIAEIAEHLALIDEGVSTLITNLLTRAETSADSNARAVAFLPVSLKEQLEQARHAKYQAPEMVRPRGGVEVEASLARIKRVRATLNSLRPRLETIDLSAARFPHPFFGALNLYQWLAFIPNHQERHLRQIERLMDAPEYER